VNTRLLPERPPTKMIEEIKRVIGDPGIEVSIVSALTQQRHGTPI
jgi:hypothetical protein